MHRDQPIIRRDTRRANTVLLASLVMLAALGACGDDSPSTAETNSTKPSTTVSPTTAVSSTTDKPQTTTAPAAGLPAEPRVLYEWYPAAESVKSIIVSDETLTAPPVRVVPEADGAAIHAKWSHDGSTLTWEVLRGDDTASVWTANADGSEPKERAACTAAPCL